MTSSSGGSNDQLCSATDTVNSWLYGRVLTVQSLTAHGAALDSLAFPGSVLERGIRRFYQSDLVIRDCILRTQVPVKS